MRILIVSYYFPPFNTAGAIRVGKIAKFLMRAGHDVRVVTACPPRLQPTLPLDIPPERVIYAGRRTALARPPAFTPREGAHGEMDYVPASTEAPGLPPLLSRLDRAFASLGNKSISWYPYALRAARRVLREWTPDLIFASYKPSNALLVAAELSRRYRIPWVAELRDLWMDNHVYLRTGWDGRIQAWLERRTLSSAAGLVTTSESLAGIIGRRYAKPVALVMNGYDPADYPPAPACPGGEGLHLVYVGTVYQGNQDPARLFAALRLLGPEAASIRVTFLGGSSGDYLRALAKKEGVEERIEIIGHVTYKESLEWQCRADALLLLLWHDDAQRGLYPYPVKVFEYIGSRRPILAVGPLADDTARLVTARHVGVALDDAEAIAAQLREWLAIKRAGRQISPIPDAAANGLTREAQTAILERFLREVAAGKADITKI